MVDSNLDWGQDLGRLRTFVQARRIEKIAVEYFGGGSPAYELGERFIPWRLDQGPYPGWVAVSATPLYRAIARASAGQPGAARAPHADLWGTPPTATIGHSMYVYDLRDLHQD